MVMVVAHSRISFAIKRNATSRLMQLPKKKKTFTSIRKLPVDQKDHSRIADRAHDACTSSCNRPHSTPHVQIVAPGQNAGGLAQLMLDGACASETRQPRGERDTQAPAGEQTSPLFSPNLGAECATLCGGDTNDRLPPAKNLLQLPLVDATLSGCISRK